MHRAPTLEHQTYNIGSGRATSNAEILGAVQKVRPAFSAELQVGSSSRYKANAYSDISRMQQLGYAPKHTYEAAIADYAAWLDAGNPQ